MAASVRIEDEAFSDLRFRVLGNSLGTSEFDALGRMAHLWRACTARESYFLPRALVATVVNPDLVIAADLAEPGGSEAEIRIKGTETRIEWLSERRKAAVAGGLATKAKWRAARPAQPKAKRRPNAGPPAPAPAPAPVLREDPSGPQHMLADRLRTLLVAEKPNHELAADAAWKKRRPGWLKQAKAALAKGEGRTLERAVELLGYVFGDQGGTKYRFVVQSPDALGEKWDAIEARMDSPARSNGSGTDRGLSAREIWEWAESVEEGEQR